MHTDKGIIRFAELVDRVRGGESSGSTPRRNQSRAPAERVEITMPEAVMLTGSNEIVRLRFSNGMELRCTPGHKLFTTNRGFVAAEDLTGEDQVKTLNLPAPAVAARPDPAVEPLFALAGRGDKRSRYNLPEKWTRIGPLPGLARRRRLRLRRRGDNGLRNRRGTGKASFPST